jgi:hypothetical protein
MNSVCLPLGLEEFELCQPAAQGDFETINLLINGESRHATWQPLAVRLIRRSQGKRLLPSDSPWLGEHALIFKQPAIEALAPMLREHGELLPLQCNEAQLWIFNPTRIVDALDENLSSVVRFSSGRIMDIKRYVFRPEALQGIEIFKIPNLRVSPTFVSEEFVERWSVARLSGLELRQVWKPS